MASKSSYASASVSVREPAVQAKSAEKTTLIREIIANGEYNRDQLQGLLGRIENLRHSILGQNPSDAAKGHESIWPSGSLHEVSAMHDVHCNLIQEISQHLAALENALI